MPTNHLPSEVLLKQLRLLFIAMLTGQLLLLVIIGSIVISKQSTQFWYTNQASFIILGLTTLTSISAIIIPCSQLRKLRTEKDDDKLYAGYRTICIIRWTLLESGVMISTIGAYFFNQPVLLLFGISGIVLFILHYPTERKLFDELRLGFKY
jgi:hypothetical protein